MGQPSVPKFADLGGSGHPTVDNFPLSLFIFGVNIPLPTHYLTLATAITLQLQPYYRNQRSFLTTAKLIAYILLQNFHVLITFCIPQKIFRYKREEERALYDPLAKNERHDMCDLLVSFQE